MSVPHLSWIITILLVVCGSLSTGCGTDPSAPPITEVEQSASQPPATPPDAAHEVEQDTPAEETEAIEPVDSESTEQGVESGEQTVGYEPPFPERIELFTPPHRENVAARGKDGENPVRLLGFAKVNDRRAVLSIDGLVYPVAEGETRAGIEVISINPPAVVLQRGAHRWQTALQN